MTKEARDAFVKGMHNLICTPREAVKDRFRFVTEERPALGSAECMCKDMTLRYNGKVV